MSPKATHKPKPKGIFCLEGDWWGKIHKRSSVEPILELLHQWDPFYVPYVRKDVATRAEFDYYLSKWAQRSMAKYPILYLAFHGMSNEFFFGDLRKTKNTVSLDELGEMLEGQCHRRIIYFGSCDTLDLHGNSIRGFLRSTGALAVCGYRRSVDWLDSVSLEMIVFSAMQMYSTTIPGAEAMKRSIEKRAPYLAKQLGFHMVIKS